MEKTKPVMGEDWNRLFDEYLSTLNDRIIRLEKQMKEIEDALRLKESESNRE